MLVVKIEIWPGGITERDETRDWPAQYLEHGRPRACCDLCVGSGWLDHVRTKEGKNVVHDRSQALFVWSALFGKGRCVYETSFNALPGRLSSCEIC